MALRPVGPDPLAEAERVQQPDVRRHEDDHQREREQQALDQLDRAHRTGRSDGRFPEAVDEPVEPDPARRLDEDDVAVAQPRRDRLERRLGVADADDPGRVQPGGLGALGDARRAVADDHQPVDRSCGGLADGAMTVVGGLAELEHLAEDRAPPAGQPGEQVERGDDRPRRGVVRVVDDGDAAEPDELHPVRRRPAGLEPGRDLVERQAGDAGRPRPPASALWTDSRPRAGMLTGRRAPSARRVKRMPSRPADATASAPTSASAAKP